MWIWEMSAGAWKCVAVEERVTVRFCCREEPIFVDYCASVHKRKLFIFYLRKYGFYWLSGCCICVDCWDGWQARGIKYLMFSTGSFGLNHSQFDRLLLLKYLLSLIWRFNSLHLKPRRILVVNMNSCLLWRAVSVLIPSERKALIPFPLFSHQGLTLGIEIQWNPVWRTKALWEMHVMLSVRATNSQADYNNGLGVAEPVAISFASY